MDKKRIVWLSIVLTVLLLIYIRYSAQIESPKVIEVLQTFNFYLILVGIGVGIGLFIFGRNK